MPPTARLPWVATATRGSSPTARAPIVRELDNPGTWMVLCGNSGLAALLTGDTDAARDAFREELELCRELVALPIAAEGLLGLAAVAVVDGDLSRAARLEAPRRHIGYGQQQDASRRGSRRCSSRPPARATEPTHGTPPSAKGLS